MQKMAKIEIREQAEDFPLGARWLNGPIRTIGTRVRIAGYERGVAIEIEGETWLLPQVESLPDFTPPR